MSAIRYALRTLIKAPGPTIVMMLTLGVAVGAATVIYGVIDVVQHFLPAPNRAGLFYVSTTDIRVVNAEGTARSAVLRSPSSVPDLVDWTARSTTFDQLAGFRPGSANLTGVAVPLRLTTISVTPNLMDVWGFTPALGRGIGLEDGRAGAPPVAMLSHAYWQQQYSTNPAVLGQRMLLDGVAHTIVGVLPREGGTGFFKDAGVFTPLLLDDLRAPRDRRDVLVTGRLRPGITREHADAELQTIASQLRSEHPDTNQRIGVSVLPLIEASGFNVRILITILALIGALIVVVACANVASVIVARSLERRHELAVHAALGATRADRVRQVLIESVLLSSGASIVGLLVAAWGMAGLRWLGSSAFGFAEMEVNGRVLAMSLLIAAAAPVGFGLLPSLRLAPPDPQELRDGARAAGATRKGRRVRNAVIGLQAAAAMVLMVQIGLFLRTTWKLSDVAPGFDPAHVVTFHVGLPESRYAEPQSIDRFIAALLARLQAVPGVASAGVIDRLPIAEDEQTARLTVEGAVLAPRESRPAVARSAIAGDVLAALRIPLHRGRTMTREEMSDGAPIALINEEAARRFWPGRDPVGARLALDAVAGQEAWLEVVGVVGNLRNSDVDQGPLPQVFVSTARQRSHDIAVVVKVAGGDPLQLVPAIRAQVAAIDPNQPIHGVASMSQVLFDDLASTYLLSAILSTIGLVALALSAAGIYGLVAYTVVQRRREIGVRMALGARPESIVGMVVAHSTRPVALGSLAGLVVAATVALLLAAAVPEIDPRDSVSYVGVIVLIAVSALCASVIPARRAASINPVEALRVD